MKALSARLDGMVTGQAEVFAAHITLFCVDRAGRCSAVVAQGFLQDAREECSLHLVDFALLRSRKKEVVHFAETILSRG